MKKHTVDIKDEYARILPSIDNHWSNIFTKHSSEVLAPFNHTQLNRRDAKGQSKSNKIEYEHIKLEKDQKL